MGFFPIPPTPSTCRTSNRSDALIQPYLFLVILFRPPRTGVSAKFERNGPSASQLGCARRLASGAPRPKSAFQRTRRPFQRHTSGRARSSDPGRHGFQAESRLRARAGCVLAPRQLARQRVASRCVLTPSSARRASSRDLSGLKTSHPSVFGGETARNPVRRAHPRRERSHLSKFFGTNTFS